MKIKKILSCFLAASTMAFSGPMAFAEWEYIDTGKRMLDFTELNGTNFRNNWCWLSTSLKLLEYWTTKRGRTGTVNNGLLNLCNRMNGLVKGSYSARRSDFRIYQPLFNKITEVLKASQIAYKGDPHEILFKGKFTCDISADEICNSLINSKAIELILNDIYKSERPFYSFYADFITNNLIVPRANTDKEVNLRDYVGLKYTPYDLTKLIIDGFKCPLIVGVGRTAEGFLSVEQVKILKLRAMAGHNLLVVGIDSTANKVLLKNPNPTDRVPENIEMSKDDFNKYIFNIFGVLDKNSSFLK